MIARNPAALLALSYAGLLSHMFLDFLNSYGIRLLMPFSGRWFYGDSVFIIDPGCGWSSVSASGGHADEQPSRPHASRLRSALLTSPHAVAGCLLAAAGAGRLARRARRPHRGR